MPERDRSQLILVSSNPNKAVEAERIPVVHENIRGAEYYDREAQAPDALEPTIADIEYLKEERIGINNDSSFEAPEPST